MGRPVTVVLLHGAVLNGRMWDPVTAELGADFEVHAPDLPGHGSRSHQPFVLTAAVAMLRELVGSLGSGPVLVAGDSLGSYVTIAAAAELDGKVAGAVLCGCTAQLTRFDGFPFLLYAGLSRLLSAERVDARLASRVRREYAAGPGMLEVGLRPAAFAEGIAELRRFDCRAAIDRLVIPTIFVNGAKDWRHRFAERHVTVGGRPVEVRRVEGVGHGVSLVAPAIYAGFVRELAERVQ